MSRNYTVQTKILRPLTEVFSAIIDRQQLQKYFVNSASGDLQEGASIKWHWNHYGENRVSVVKVIKNQLIELALDSKEWEKTAEEAYEVRVIFEFESLEDGGTLLSISEAGWKTNLAGLKGSHDNCGGWMHMTMCLKAWLEHNIDLR